MKVGNKVKGKDPKKKNPKQTKKQNHWGRALTSFLYIFLHCFTGCGKCVTFMIFKELLNYILKKKITHLEGLCVCMCVGGCRIIAEPQFSVSSPCPLMKQEAQY